MIKKIIVSVVMIAIILITETGCAPAFREPGTQATEAPAERTGGLKSGKSAGRAPVSAAQETQEAPDNPEEQTADAPSGTAPAFDFTLPDQYGNTHTLSEYKGHVVFLNFWATWCPPCREEMPDIQKLYKEYEEAGDDSVVFLGVAAPGLGGETDIAGITDFLSDNGYTYPVVMDETGELFMQYYVFSYPTTYMIDSKGEVFGYLTGSMTEGVMRDVIEQTVSGSRKQQ